MSAGQQLQLSSSAAGEFSSCSWILPKQWATLPFDTPLSHSPSYLCVNSNHKLTFTDLFNPGNLQEKKPRTPDNCETVYLKKKNSTLCMPWQNILFRESNSLWTHYMIYPPLHGFPGHVSCGKPKRNQYTGAKVQAHRVIMLCNDHLNQQNIFTDTNPESEPCEEFWQFSSKFCSDTCNTLEHYCVWLEVMKAEIQNMKYRVYYF